MGQQVIARMRQRSLLVTASLAFVATLVTGCGDSASAGHERPNSGASSTATNDAAEAGMPPSTTSGT